MKTRYVFMNLLCAVTGISLAGDLNPANASRASIHFTENKGQVHDQFNHSRPDVLFGGSDGALAFHLRTNGVSYQLRRVDKWKTVEIKRNYNTMAPAKTRSIPEQTTIYRLDINWPGANPAALISSGKATGGYSNYYLENCPGGVRNVKTYEDVTYRDLYPGIDLTWYGQDDHLKYDYLVAAGADYKKIRLEIKGAEAIHLDASGQLVISTPLGEINEQAPLVRQGAKILPAKWVVEGNKDDAFVLSFEIERINSGEAFTIDPLVRVWGTYYGGNYEESGGGVVTPAGESYLAGYTGSATGTVIATSGSCQDIFYGGYYDAFLAKFNAAGQRLWGTYFGGGGDDFGGNCALDASGNSYLCGSTDSGTNIMATAGSHQPTYGGNGDAFLAKFDPNGGLYWSTYYGGVGTDDGNTCAVDKSGNVYLCGNAGSTGNISTPGAHQPGKASMYTSPFLVKFNPAGVRQWGTYYAGSNGANAGTCSTDKQGNIFFTGTVGPATGTDIATPGTHQQAYAGGTGSDGFVAKFNTSGVRLWGTFYGGTRDDYAGYCTADAAGNFFLTGVTESTNGISTPGTHQPAFGGGYRDGYIAKFDASGQRLWATYYGGSGADYMGMTLDKDENILLSGSTDSGSGTVIATPGSYKPTFSGGAADMFIAKLTPAGKRLWGTYYGGSGDDWGGIAGIDNSSNLFIAGETSTSTGTVFATPGCHQPTYGGSTSDMFLVKFQYCSPPVPANSTPSANLVVCEGETATLMASASGTLSWFTGETGGTALGTGTTFVTSVLSTGSYTYYVEAATCEPGELRTAISLTVNACTGIEAPRSGPEGWKLYPNPNNGNFRVQAASEGNIIIHNVLGQVVCQQKHTGTVSEINMTDVEKGVYFVNFNSGQDNYTIKVLKE